MVFITDISQKVNRKKAKEFRIGLLSVGKLIYCELKLIDYYLLYKNNMRLKKFGPVAMILSLLLIIESNMIFSGLEYVQAQQSHVTLATMSMSLEMLKETKEVWANMILNELSRIAVKDLIFEEGMVGDNKFYITGV